MGLTVDLNYSKFIKEIFPFHIYINQNFKIIGAGESLLKIFQIELDNDFSNFFLFLRPFSVETKYNSVLGFTKQLFIIKSNINTHLLLRGQMIPMKNNCLLFIGSPWINNIETIGNLGLTLNDFALHDSTTDLLHLLKTKDIVSADLESVTKIVREQNKELSLQKTILDDVVESTNLGTWRWNVQTGETVFNERWAEIIGYTLEELTPTNIDTWLKYAYEPDLEKSGKKLEEHFLGKSSNYDVEVRMKHKNGKIIWVRDRGKVISWTKDGKPLWMYGTHEDITLTKNKQSELLNQKTFYESILNAIPSDIAVFDSNHKYLFVNPVAIKDKKKREWIIGKDDFEYCNKYSRPIEIANTRRELFNEAKKGSPKIIEEKISSNNGDEYHLRQMFPVFDNDKNIKMVIGYGVNITEIKKTQLKLENITNVVQEQNQTLLERNESLKKLVLSLDDIIIEISEDLIFKNAWVKDEKYLFLEKDKFINKQVKEVFNNELGENIINNVFSVLTSGNKTEFEYQEPSGNMWFSAIFNLFEYSNHKSVLVTIRNITEKKAYQESLIKSKKRAEELAKSKDVFLANISHELRNPINIINGLTDLISVENTSQTIQQHLSKIQNASQTLLTLVNDILEFENYNSGNLKIHKSNFDFEKDLLLSLFSYRLSSTKGNKLVINSPQKQIGEIYSDKDRIKQVLFNLLSNADKFTNGGIITISVNHTLNNNNENILTISVKDNGIGIKKSEQKKIFERYGRADEVENNISGSGLGLSIVKSILDALGGGISLKSTYGKGSEFVVEIPLESAQVSVKNKIGKKTKFNYSNYSVLIVDDDEINRLILENFLNRNNIRFESASNGKEALNIINNKDFDFIFLDLQMPIMDGFECAKKIRELSQLNKRSSNIIALSANVFAEKKIKSNYLGFSGFISKPYDENKIISSINTVVEASCKYNKSLENLFDDKTLINSTKEILLMQIVELLNLINEEFNDEKKKLIKDKLHKITPSLFYIQEDSVGELTRELEEKIISKSYTNEEIFTKLNLIGVELVKVLGALKIMNCV